MDLVSYNTDDLSAFRPNDYFFEPASRKIYQYRNKEGKAIIVREIGKTNITKLFKNTLKTVLKVEGEFDKYQVISISDTSVTLFNTNIGEDFEVGFGDADNIDEIKTAFNKGDEVIAEVFDYDDIKETIKLTIASVSTNAEIQPATETPESKISSSELQRIKEIEEKKAKKRPFITSESGKKPDQKVSKVKRTPSKETKEVVEKKESPAKKSSKKVVKKVEKVSSKKEKKETKEEKKAREKREKEEQKEREKREKEEQKALEKKRKEEEKAKKKKK